MDSARNCHISFLRDDPKTLRKPTLASRLVDLAVDKFMKFIPAMRRIKIPIMLNIYR